MINQVDNRSLSGMLLTETGLRNQENFVFVKKGKHLNLNCTFHHFAEKSRENRNWTIVVLIILLSQSNKLELI